MSIGYISGNYYIAFRSGVGMQFTPMSNEELTKKFTRFFCCIREDETYKKIDGLFQNKKTEKNYNNLVKYYKEKFAWFRQTLHLSIFQPVSFSVMDDNYYPFYNEKDVCNFDKYKKNNLFMPDKYAYNNCIKALKDGYSKEVNDGNLTVCMKCGQALSGHSSSISSTKTLTRLLEFGGLSIGLPFATYKGITAYNKFLGDNIHDGNVSTIETSIVNPYILEKTNSINEVIVPVENEVKKLDSIVSVNMDVVKYKNLIEDGLIDENKDLTTKNS